MMTVKANGTVFNGFTSLSVIDSVDNFCKQFKLTCSASDQEGSFTFPIKRGSTIEVMVNDKVVFIGFVEKVSGNYSSDSYEIKVEGRDNGKSILKADLPPSFNLKGPISLKDIFVKTLKANGLQFEVENQAGIVKDFSTKEIVNDDVGTSTFDFWLELAKKRQLIISKDIESTTVYILRPNQNKYRYSLNNYIDNIRGLNNIVSGDFSFDDSDRRNEYNVYSQEPATSKRARNTSELLSDLFAENKQDQVGKTVSAADKAKQDELNQRLNQYEPGSQAYTAILKQLSALQIGASDGFRRSRVATKGTATDDAIPVGSVFHKVAETPSTDDECQEQAEWECNTQRVRAVTFSCVVAEMEADGEPWKAGYLIDVFDEIASINSTMLIKDVEFTTETTEDGDVEEITNLTLTIPDGFTDDATASSSQQQTSEIGENWNLESFQ